MYENLKVGTNDPQVLESIQILRVTYSSFTNREEVILICQNQSINFRALMFTE